jgi:hypothetical protein
MAVKGMTWSGIGVASVPSTMQGGLINSPMAGLELSRDDTEEDYQGYTQGGNGILQDLYTITTQQTWSLNNTFQAIDGAVVELMFREMKKTTTSYKFKRQYPGTVPASAAYTITDSKLVGLAVADVRVAISPTSNYAHTFLKVVTIAPASANEVQLDNAAGTLTFHSAQAGRNFTMELNESYANIDTIGIESSYTAVNTVSYTGGLSFASKPNTVIVDAPDCQPTGGINFSVGQENTLNLKPLAGGNRTAVRLAFIS